MSALISPMYPPSLRMGPPPVFRSQAVRLIRCRRVRVRRVVCSRLKRGGMHWTVEGANAIIALQCNLLSGRFEDLWEQRAHAA